MTGRCAGSPNAAFAIELCYVYVALLGTMIRYGDCAIVCQGSAWARWPGASRRFEGRLGTPVQRGGRDMNNRVTLVAQPSPVTPRHRPTELYHVLNHKNSPGPAAITSGRTGGRYAESPSEVDPSAEPCWLRTNICSHLWQLGLRPPEADQPAMTGTTENATVELVTISVQLAPTIGPSRSSITVAARRLDHPPRKPKGPRGMSIPGKWPLSGSAGAPARRFSRITPSSRDQRLPGKARDGQARVA